MKPILTQSEKDTLEMCPDVRILKHLENGDIVDQHGVILTEKETMGFNHILRTGQLNNKGFRYNANLFSEMTLTPQHFWETASQKNKEYVMSLIEDDLAKITNKLFKYRELEVKKIMKRRSIKAYETRKKNETK